MGQDNVQFRSTEPKTAESLSKDRMRLYRHLTMCGRAMQYFLEQNPHYWCLVPMREQDIDDRIAMTSEQHQPYDVEIDFLINHLPVPPEGYRFSCQQRRQQYEFFKNELDRKPTTINDECHLFRSTIIFVCMLL